MIRRGDVVVAELSPIIGHEQGGRRPVLVVSRHRRAPELITSYR
jgi:PemK-like protein.